MLTIILALALFGDPASLLARDECFIRETTEHRCPYCGARWKTTVAITGPVPCPAPHADSLATAMPFDWGEGHYLRFRVGLRDGDTGTLRICPVKLRDMLLKMGFEEDTRALADSIDLTGRAGR